MLTRNEKEIIGKLAIEEKFSQVGFAEAEPVVSDIKDLYLRWLYEGKHAGMKWMETTKETRTDLKSFSPGAKSVIVFLHSYFHGHNTGKQSEYKIASYAHGKDYHKLLRKKLKRIAEKMRTEFGEFEYKISVDSAPVMEKYWAQKAGLGWIGKNGLLISPKMGSFHFIAILVTTLNIEADEPFRYNYCGTCNKCREACPTSAIKEKGIIDSNKCLSYLNIEHKGEIAGELREKISPWLFGCDVCQEVCPWNSKAEITGELRFHDQYSLGEIKYLLNNCSETKFNEYFAGTPVRRAGFEHFKYVAKLIKND